MKKNEYTTENPTFSDKLDILETTDPGHADILNPINKQLFENTLYLNTKMNECIGGTDNPDGGIGFVEGIEANNVIDAINEVFQLGSERKSKLVENLTAMGVPASTEETWEELLDKVLDMTDTSKDTVTAEVLLDGYTAHNATGKLITGIMPERARMTVSTTGVTQDSSYTYFGVPEGHYDENSKVRAINSDLLGNIYDAFVAAGVTPTAKTPAALVSAVTTLKNSSGYKGVVLDSGNYRWTGTNEGSVSRTFNVPRKGKYLVLELSSGMQLSGFKKRTVTVNGVARSSVYTCWTQGEGQNYEIWSIDANAGDTIVASMSNESSGNGDSKFLRIVIIEL